MIPTPIKVSVVVPCRNEVKFIEMLVESLICQKLDGILLEIIIADGMSDDGTREVLANLCYRHSELVVVDNPELIVSTGLNNAIRMANGDIIVRIDAHAEYSHDYIYQCVQTLMKTGSENVGGPWCASGTSYRQKAIALAFQSPFSSGGAGSHSLDYEGEVDTVYLGCWKKETLENVGLFDEELVRNQDDELNLRIIRSGGKIWQSPKIKSWYYPRASILALFKQYMQYGYWKVRVIQKHKIPASLRHLVPGGFLGCLLLLAVLSPVSTFASQTFLFLIGAYFISNLAASVITCRNPSLFKYLLVMPTVFAAYHFGYGYGFLRGVIDFVFLRKGGHNSFNQLTRG